LLLSAVDERVGGDNRPISWTTRLWLSARRYIFFQLDFLQEAEPRFLPASWRIAAGSGTGVRLRSSLSQCRSRWSGLLPAGPKTRTRSSYAGARFANRIRLLVMAGGANRRTTRITIGSGFAAAVAEAAEDLHLVTGVFSALHTLQPAGTLPGMAAALCGALLMGEGIAQAPRP
jgi:hypothetical protein